MQAAKEITNINNVNPESLGANTPATTTLYMIEQGLNELKAIYNRQHRSLKEEVSKILYFTKKYSPLKEYLEIMDYGEAGKEDFEKSDNYEIVPNNNSSSLTSGQTIMRANAVYEMAIAGNPFMSLEEATKYRLKALKVDNPESLTQDQPVPQPNPMEQAMAENQIELGKAQNALLNAQASSIKDKTQIDKLKFQVDTLTAKIKAGNDTLKTRIDAMEKLVNMQEKDPDTSQEKDAVDKYAGTLSLPGIGGMNGNTNRG